MFFICVLICLPEGRKDKKFIHIGNFKNVFNKLFDYEKTCEGGKKCDPSLDPRNPEYQHGKIKVFVRGFGTS